MGKYHSIALDNEAIVEAGFYTCAETRVDIADAVEESCRGVRSYTPSDTKRLEREQAYRSAEHDTAFEVTPETSTQAAERLIRGEGESAVGVLNFASARNPGGGYLRGARAQEEDLCRCSALYTTLLQAPDYYDAHRTDRDTRYSHRVIYSPDVPAYRDNKSRLLPEPYQVSFLTSPAPNAGALRRSDPGALAGIRDLIVERAARVLAVALHHGVRVIVLGAWGCGVFANDPENVAGVFAFHLGAGGAFAGRFERVVFAVYDTSAAQSTIEAFRDAFPEGPRTRHVEFGVARTT
jgi:uncharacterized protein (TIGR02452 family)